MKKWEEERRKKIYNDKIKAVKSTVNTNNRPKSSKTPGMHSKNTMRQSTAGIGRRSTIRNSSDYMVSPGTDPSMSSKIGDLISEEVSLEMDEIPVDQTLVFKLLQSFKLQQYAKKMMEYGFGMEVYKLAILTGKEREKLIENLRPLPGHTFRFDDMFTFLEAIYPRENAARELARPNHLTYHNNDPENKFLAASNQQKPKKKTRSLIKKYERLDPYKKDEINKRFLDNLKIKGGISIGKLIKQVIRQTPVIQNIFPPDQFGYEDILGQ
jgi:hypothetical protein